MKLICKSDLREMESICECRVICGLECKWCQMYNKQYKDNMRWCSYEYAKSHNGFLDDDMSLPVSLSRH